MRLFRPSRKPRLTGEQLAQQLERLLQATSWTERTIQDELANVPIGDPDLDRIREEAMRLSYRYAAAGGVTYFGPSERSRVRALIAQLRPAHVAAHKHSIRHREELERSVLCGCFYCVRTFPPSAIKDWVDDATTHSGQTALCPHCGIDAVIGDASGYAIEPEFLARMQRHWF